MKIEKSKYEGYLWYSNENEPDIIDNNTEFELEITDTKNPFIIEGQLYDGKKSISIKYTDGQYIVKEYDMSKLETLEKEPKSFKANRMKRWLNFNQYWRAGNDTRDPLCENMEVLQPAELVFIGFGNEIKEDEK
jgi:CRISPR type III-associated protein (TIGR04423 family)